MRSVFGPLLRWLGGTGLDTYCPSSADLGLPGNEPGEWAVVYRRGFRRRDLACSRCGAPVPSETHRQRRRRFGP